MSDSEDDECESTEFMSEIVFWLFIYFCTFYSSENAIFEFYVRLVGLNRIADKFKEILPLF